MLQRTEIWHADYNLQRRDNLSDLPVEKAVFGIFGIVDDEPVNCRYVGETENLQATVRQLFTEPVSEGLGKFLTGPWIKMLQFLEAPESSLGKRKELVKEWEGKYNPAIDKEGEYPGYYTD